jgi:hypothetical protein
MAADRKNFTEIVITIHEWWTIRESDMIQTDSGQVIVTNTVNTKETYATKANAKRACELKASALPLNSETEFIVVKNTAIVERVIQIKHL